MSQWTFTLNSSDDEMVMIEEVADAVATPQVEAINTTAATENVTSTAAGSDSDEDNAWAQNPFLRFALNIDEPDYETIEQLRKALDEMDDTDDDDLLEDINEAMDTLRMDSNKEPQPSCSGVGAGISHQTRVDISSSSSSSDEGSFEIVSNSMCEEASKDKEDIADVLVADDPITDVVVADVAITDVEVVQVDSAESSSESSEESSDESSDETSAVDRRRPAVRFNCIDLTSCAPYSSGKTSGSQPTVDFDESSDDDDAYYEAEPAPKNMFQITFSSNVQSRTELDTLIAQCKASAPLPPQSPPATLPPTVETPAPVEPVTPPPPPPCRTTIDLCVEQMLLVPELKTGFMKFFNNRIGYGFIVGDDGIEYFCHKTALQMNRFQRIPAGERVMFTTRHRETKPRPAAIDVCGTALALDTVKFRERLFRCYNCGVYGNHMADTCPHPHLFRRCCYICKSKQHLSADCPSQNANTREVLLPVSSTQTVNTGSEFVESMLDSSDTVVRPAEHHLADHHTRSDLETFDLPP